MRVKSAAFEVITGHIVYKTILSEGKFKTNELQRTNPRVKIHSRVARRLKKNLVQ